MNHLQDNATYQFDINIWVLFRDNAPFMNRFNELIDGFESGCPELSFQYTFFENGSVDETPSILKSFYQNKSDRTFLFSESDYEQKHKIGNLSRTSKLAHLRNHSKDLFIEHNQSRFALMLDTNIEFKPEVILEMIDFLDHNQDVAMVSTYGREKGDETHYYDTFAFRDAENNNYWPGCIFPCERCQNSKIDMSKPYYPRAAFGGCSLIRPKILSSIKWASPDHKTCEHVSFCDDVLKHGKIAILPWLDVIWHEFYPAKKILTKYL